MSITLSSDIKGNAANVAAKVIAEANADRMGGVIHQASSLAQLNAWITDETARIALDPSGFTACIWGQGALLRVSTEAPGVFRQWDRTAGTPNALTVLLPNSSVITLAANTNTVISTDGAPSNGVGSNGDYAFDSESSTLYGPKAAGTWPGGVVIFGSSEPSTTDNFTYLPDGNISSFDEDDITVNISYNLDGTVHTVTKTGVYTDTVTYDLNGKVSSIVRT